MTRAFAFQVSVACLAALTTLAPTTLHSGASAPPDGEALPVGTVVAYAGEHIPQGWLLCDGAVYTRDSEPELYAAIGTAHGAGLRGSQKLGDFNVPDLRGRFIRGLDDSPAEGRLGSDKDALTRLAPVQGTGNAGNKIGSWESSAFESHTHGVNDPGHTHLMPHRALADGDGGFGHGGPVDHGSSVSDFGDSKTVAAATTGITLQMTGGWETRPENIALYYIIKAKP